MNIPEFRPLPYETAEQLVAAFEAGVRFVVVEPELSRVNPVKRMELDYGALKSWVSDGYIRFASTGCLASGGKKVYLTLADKQPAKPEADAAGWIEWGGGECPVPPDTLVDVRLSCNSNVHSRWVAGKAYWACRHDGGIVAYRIVKSATEKAELGYHKGVPRESLADVMARKRRELAPILEASMSSLRCIPASDRAGIDRFIPPPEPALKPAAPPRVSTLNRGWRWL